MLAVVGVAAAALGTGFLGNQVELWIQQFGVGSGDIVTPIDHVQVDFNIRAQQVVGAPEGDMENVADCVLTLRQDVGQVIGTPIDASEPNILVEKDSELTCKFTNEAGNVIAEATIGTPLNNDDPLDPNFPACINPANIFDFPCNKVGGIFLAGEHTLTIGTPVGDLHDVIVVVHSNEYSMGDFP